MTNRAEIKWGREGMVAYMSLCLSLISEYDESIMLFFLCRTEVVERKSLPHFGVSWNSDTYGSTTEWAAHS